MRIGIVGDRNPESVTHRATENALATLPDPLPFEWLPTETLARGEAGERLAACAGLLIAPGACRNMAGALAAIRYAREAGRPLLGTCGGFQNLVLEFVRNVLGFADADHAETNPAASRLAITPLACSLVGRNRPVRIVAGSRAAAIYGTDETVEPFFCRYGLNPDYRPMLERRGLCVSGVGEDDEVRILELAGHPFFFGTLFVPQARSTAGEPHPLLAAFAAAVLAGSRDGRPPESP